MITLLAESLLRRALTTLPPELRARYEQEWRADLAELNGFAALLWALGLSRASRKLRAQAGAPRRAWATVVPRLALDAAALALAYYAAFMLRFGGDIPSRYQDLLDHTLPAAVVAGLIALALAGLYTAGHPGPLRLYRGVGLATLAIIAYVAVVQPTLVVTHHGFTSLNLPAGICVLFALTAAVLMTGSRAGLALARAARS